MRFSSFYPYAQTVTQTSLTSYLSRSSSLAISYKSAIDSLFSDLEKSEDQPEKFPQILTRCQFLIDRYKKLKPSPRLTSSTILSLMAVQMEIYRRQNNAEEISARFNALFREIDFAVRFDHKLVAHIAPELITNLQNLVQELSQHLTHLPQNISSEARELPVPEILANASFVAGDAHDLNKIRKVFYDLWQDEKLRPLLASAAHATKGNYCDDENGVYQDRNLRFIFFKPSAATGLNSSNPASAQEVVTKYLPIVLYPYPNEEALKRVITKGLQQTWHKSFHRSKTKTTASETENTDEKQLSASLSLLAENTGTAFSITEDFSQIPQHLSYQPNAIYQALYDQNHDLVRLLIASPDFHLEARDNFGASAFESLVEYGEPQLVLEFLES